MISHLWEKNKLLWERTFKGEKIRFDNMIREMKNVWENKVEENLTESKAEGQRDGCKKRKKIILFK